MMKEKIQTSLEYLANLTLEDHENHREYTDKDLVNATQIFSGVLMDVIYTNAQHLSRGKQLELAENAGTAIRELIRATTDKDMHQVIKEVYPHA